MDREKLFKHLEQRYISKRDMISRVPLGVDPEALWQELLNRRRSKGTVLPLYGRTGTPYWYNTTDRMVAASEKIVEALLENETEFDPYTEAPPVCTLEEVFYTSYVEGAQITIQAAMDFLTGGQPPRDIEEQLITNNRLAGNYAGANLYRPIDEGLLGELAYILTDGIDGGGQHYRTTDDVDYPPVEGEHLSFPPALMIPDKINELTAFLASPQIHPLIKAGAAQAYMMVLRPFPEGNERLGRVLSTMILLRAGYTFFSDVSLSALIARKSYGYYEAVANILREENGGDMTYFMEYFLELLSRAIDERRLRQARQEEQARQAEQELARTALVPSPSFPPDDDPGRRSETVPKENCDHGTEALPEGIKPTGMNSARAVLVKCTESGSEILSRLSYLLLQRLDAGTIEFTSDEMASALEISAMKFGGYIRNLMGRGVIRRIYRDEHRTFYQICNVEEMPVPDGLPDDAEPTEHSPAIIDRINTLVQSNSPKDRRLGNLLLSHAEKGAITKDDYAAIGKQSRWAGDMQLASQMGLVRQDTPSRCTILKVLSTEPLVLRKCQKKIITEMYELFGDDVFSTSMAFATLDYTETHISAYLHQFTLLRILDCRKGDVFQYQFLVNPEENPEYFDVAS